jgi:hypothetical protein
MVHAHDFVLDSVPLKETNLSPPSLAAREELQEECRTKLWTSL